MTKNAYPFQYVVNKILFIMNMRSKLKFKTMLSRFAGVLKSPLVFKIEFWICLHTVLIEIIRIPTVMKPNSMKPLWKMSLTTMWKSRMASSSPTIPGHIFWNTKEYILQTLKVSARHNKPWKGWKIMLFCLFKRKIHHYIQLWK